MDDLDVDRNPSTFRICLIILIESYRLSVDSFGLGCIVVNFMNMSVSSIDFSGFIDLDAGGFL